VDGDFTPFLQTDLHFFQAREDGKLRSVAGGKGAAVIMLVETE
jgi:hypothetical protein